MRKHQHHNAAGRGNAELAHTGKDEEPWLEELGTAERTGRLDELDTAEGTGKPEELDIAEGSGRLEELDTAEGSGRLKIWRDILDQFLDMRLQ